jgi:hypothetical protein
MYRNQSFLVLVILLLFVVSLTHTQGAPGTRAEFAAAMAKITEGTTEKEVLDLLGKPDDVRTEFDPGGIGRVNTKEIWCYGSKGHLSFPTLGCVYIDEDGHALEVFGGRGNHQNRIYSRRMNCVISSECWIRPPGFKAINTIRFL